MRREERWRVASRMEMGFCHKERRKCEFGRSILKNIYNIDTHEEVAVNICGFDGIQM